MYNIYMSIASHAWVQSPVLKKMKDKQKFFWNFPFSSKTVEFTYKRVHHFQSAEKKIVKQESRIQ